MAKLPYMRVYVNDLIGDTSTLSDAEFGSYVMILMAMWKAGGWLTPDQARKASKCAAGRWAKRWTALAGYFETEDDGRITNARVREDLADNGRLDDRRSRGAPAKAEKVVPAETKKQVSAETTKSGPNRLKNNEPTPPDSRALAQSHIPEGREVEESPSDPPQPVVEAIEDAKVVVLHPADDWPRGDAHAWGKALCAFRPTRLSMDRELQLVTSLGQIESWRQLGARWSDVVRTVQGLKPSGEPIRTWGYLTPAIRKTVAARLQAARPIDATDLPATGDHHDDKFARRHDNYARSEAGFDWLVAVLEKSAGGSGEFG